MTPVDMELAEKISAFVDELPPMPQNIVELRKAASNPNANFQSLVPFIKNDPGLCADVLHMANSAYYCVHHEVDTVDEAVRYFGVEHLIDFISVAFAQKKIRKHFKILKDLNEYFEHSQQISMATYLLMKYAHRSAHAQNQAAVAGLLHDIGRLVILLVSRKSTTKAIGQSWESVRQIVDNERQVLGLDHCEIGMKVCRKWHFTDMLTDAVLKHHIPFADTETHDEAAFVLMAHFISMPKFPVAMLKTLFKPEQMAHLGLNEDVLLTAREKFFESWPGSTHFVSDY